MIRHQFRICEHERKAFALFLLVLLSTLVGTVGEIIPVYTEKGPVEGFGEDGVFRFLGIPFAKPPIGDLRWRRPQEMDPWKGTRDAKSLPNSCVQGLDTFFGDFVGSTMWNANTKISEDCLYLNIWVPNSLDSPMKKAVLVWIYGGGFITGTSTLDLYMGNHLARQNDVVVVSIQYRLGILGFLSLDVDEVDDNVGLHDQLLALKWIQNNIENFGGDKRRVTLMGESAGAASIGFLLLCPYCGQYFHGAILQSGAPTAKWSYLTREESRARAKHVAQEAACENLDGGDPAILICFQNWKPEQFSDNQWYAELLLNFSFVPVIDHDFIPGNPSTLLKSGNFSKKPLLLGSNSDEASVFLAYTDKCLFPIDGTPFITLKKYNDAMLRERASYPNPGLPLAVDTIASFYRGWLRTDDKDALLWSLVNSLSDYHYVCPVNKLAHYFTKKGVSVYYYWFDQRWSANPWPKWMGVLQGDEIWFTFGHPFNASHKFSEEEKQLSRLMMAYWTNFAKTGDPNMSPNNGCYTGEDYWHLYGSERHFKLLSVKAMNEKLPYNNPGTGRCPLWDTLLDKPIAKLSYMRETCRIYGSRGQRDAPDNWTISVIAGFPIITMSTFRNFGA